MHEVTIYINMPQSNNFGLNQFKVIAIFFVEACIAIDLRKTDFAYNFNVTSLNYGNNELTVSAKETTRMPAACSTKIKWQVGRVSHKQYEIINMLWRKKNMFTDEDDNNNNSEYTQQLNIPTQFDHLHTIQDINSSRATTDSAPITHSSTISFIEFYYLDEDIESSTRDLDNDLKENRNSEKKKEVIGQLSPIFSFRLSYRPALERMVSSFFHLTPYDDNQYKSITKSTTNNINSKVFKNESRYASYTTETTPTTISELNDRVKFFEIYDNNTPQTNQYNTQIVAKESATKSYKENKAAVEKRLQLEQVDKDVGHGLNQIRYAKKHIKDKDMANNFTHFVKSLFKSNELVEPKPVLKPLEIKHIKQDTNAMKSTWDDIYNFTSEVQKVLWSKYPFAAVYVYERYQVHCDAAAISPYWLISAAACISRHREDPEGDRSAFITYCGDNWWQPERIAYVKYTLVHPRYHPKEAVRSHLYNIGVIQVASSMASSCPEWAPVSIISYHYISDKNGSLGSALGWGLNRYDTSYASHDLPRYHLSVYKDLIYSHTCPGNSGYSNMKLLSMTAVSNIYCLRLPNYNGEGKDPVHGGLLLVGGKLIALYLQEERRRWGNQSAQYTGVWRLAPWIHEVAKDPDDMEFLLNP